MPEARSPVQKSPRLKRSPNPVVMARRSVVLVTWGKEIPSSQTPRKELTVLTSPDKQFQFRVFGFGTGFVVNAAGQVATCFHVIEEALRLKLPHSQIVIWQLSDSGLFCPHPIDPEKIADSVSNDLAVLTPKESKLQNPLPGPPVRAYSEGQHLFYWGWFYRPERRTIDVVLRSGILSAVVQTGDNGAADRLLFEGVAAVGSSGSALVNPAGELVGMVSALHLGHDLPPGLGEAVPAGAIDTILSDLQVKPAWSK